MTNENQRRNEDRYPGRLWIILRSFFIVAGVAATICMAMITITLSRVVSYTPPPLPEKIVLYYSFKGNILETVGTPSLTHPLLRPATTLREVTEALETGAKDAHVKGFVARLDGAKFSVAQIQELRDAVHIFRKAGKFAWFYTDSFQPGMSDYYLASAFGRIWLQPVGAVSLNGIAAEVPFAKDFLDKIGINAEFNHKGIYKSMPESMTRTGMSAPHREMISALVDDLAQQIETGIAADRGMKLPDLKKKIDTGLFVDEDALKEGLIDKIGYYDEVIDAAKAEAGIDTKGLVKLTGYALLSDTLSLSHGMVGFTTKLLRQTAPPGAYSGKAKIALIYGVGNITSSSTQSPASFGEGGMGADKMTEAFRTALEDPDVAAVVFRIDSPGGSPEAAETIRRAVVEMKKKGRPVIVSMGSYAASGGYWIATPADKIVAEPATLTGSIGVFGGKMDLSPLWKKIGVNWDSVSQGENARMWSSNKPFSATESARFEAILDGIYKAFIARVAEGRHMTKEQVEAVAEGRVWTGQQAKARGLVDELGGIDRAIVLAKEAAKLDPTAEIPVLQYPPRKSALELFLSLAIDGEDSVSILPFNLDIASLTQAFATAYGRNAVLKMPAVIVE
jgi:protease-4